jgi:hypothetical protein
MNISELQREGKSGRWKRNKTKKRLNKIKKLKENYTKLFPKYEVLKCCIHGVIKRKIS